jgi:hypothetical protein
MKNTLKLYKVIVHSQHYAIKGSAKVLALAEKQAQEMALVITITNVQGFLDGPIRSPNKNPVKIDRVLFAKDATYETTLLADGPTVLDSAWDRI